MKRDNTTFAPRTDAFVRGVTIGVLLLLGFIAVGALGVGARPASNAIPLVVSIAAVVVVVSIVLVAYRYTPSAFVLEKDRLRIVRPASDVTVPFETIQSVARYDRFLGLSIKAPPGGNSGLFGLYGRFYRRDLGPYDLYGRAATGAVVISTTHGKILVTPERRDAFIAELRERLPT